MPPPPSLPHQPAAATPLNLGDCFARGLRDRLKLHYADRDGAITEREVTVDEIWGKRGDAPGYAWVNWLVGYCHLRQERRHFAVRSIQKVGEADWRFVYSAKAVQPFLAARYGVPVPSRGYDPNADGKVFRSVMAPAVTIDHVGEDGTTARYRFTPERVEVFPTRRTLRLTGQAIRERTASRRAWGGRRILLHEPPGEHIVSLTQADGSQPNNLLEWAASLPAGPERLDRI